MARAIVIGCLAAAAGCSQQPQGSTVHRAASLYGSPEQATLSWFYAVNHKNDAAAVAHFTPSSAGMMDWGGGDTSTWSTFTKLHCKTSSQDAEDAVVYCTFVESQSPSEGNPDSFWTVALHRQQDGRWLITNYGQG